MCHLSEWFNEVLLWIEPLLLQFINDQTEKMIWISIRKNPKSINYAKIKTDEMWLYVLTQCPKMIKDLETQSEDLCWAALKRSPYIIKYIKSPTRDMKYYAIAGNVGFGNIPNTTEQDELYALKTYNDCILYQVAFTPFRIKYAIKRKAHT